VFEGTSAPAMSGDISISFQARFEGCLEFKKTNSILEAPT
jgi:hypothetical protein